MIYALSFTWSLFLLSSCVNILGLFPCIARGGLHRIVIDLYDVVLLLKSRWIIDILLWIRDIVCIFFHTDVGSLLHPRVQIWSVQRLQIDKVSQPVSACHG